MYCTVVVNATNSASASIRHLSAMKPFSISSQVSINKPLSVVFPFFSNAANLQQITPPWLQFEVVSPTPIEMKVGQTIDYRLRVRGLPLRWRSEITVWEPPYRFVDEQLKGPYRIWHHEHVFSESNGQTHCEDRVTYAVWGGAIANRMFVAGDVRRIFEYRGQRLKEIFDGSE